jgi:exonuclease III
MRILFWNVRGVGKSHRKKLVANHVFLEDLDVVAIQETIKQDFTDGELKEMARNKAMVWHWTPAIGHSGGLAVGVNSDIFEIEDTKLLQYSLWILIRNRMSNFRFWVVDIYGPAQHKHSKNFILELSNCCVVETLPVVLGAISTSLGAIMIGTKVKVIRD